MRSNQEEPIRVCGQRDDRDGTRRTRDTAGALRHAGLHGDLDELDLVGQGVLDHFVGACADPAGGDDQVGVCGVPAQCVPEGPPRPLRSSWGRCEPARRPRGPPRRA